MMSKKSEAGSQTPSHHRRIFYLLRQPKRGGTAGKPTLVPIRDERFDYSAYQGRSDQEEKYRTRTCC